MVGISVSYAIKLQKQSRSHPSDILLSGFASWFIFFSFVESGEWQFFFGIWSDSWVCFLACFVGFLAIFKYMVSLSFFLC